MDWGPLVAQAAQRYGVPPQLAMGVLNAESSGNPQAVSPVGAQGLMQLMPATAAGLGVTDPFNPAQNINGGVQYLGQMLHQFGSPQAALAAYNWGPGNVARYGVNAAPASTKSYVAKVLTNLMPMGSANAAELPPQQQAASAPWANALTDNTAPNTTQGAPSAPWANALTTQPQQPQRSPQTPQQPNGGILRNLGMGALKGAADIGATIEQPFDWINDKLSGTTGTNAARRQALSSFFNDNAAPNSLSFKAGDLASSIAGTAGVGGVLAAPVKAAAAAIPALQGIAGPLAAALESGGFKTGLAPTSALGSAGNLALRTGAGSAVGAASAGLIDPQNAGYGAALGGVLPGAAQGIGSLGRSLYGAVAPVINPASYVGRGMASMLSPQDAAAAASSIRNAQTFVPGSSPTTAQVAGSPLLVQTEKAAGNIPDFKTAQLARDVENNQARWNVLTGVAQTPEALQAAVAARAAQAQPLYDAAHQATANVGPAFMRYAQIPEMQQAMQRANSLASLDAAVGRGTAPVWPTPDSKVINGSALDYTSRSLGDMISEAQRAGANTKAASLAALKGKVDDWMGAYVPGVNDARAAYAAASVPINTMETAQQVANQLGTRAMGAGGIAQLQLNPYRSALTQAMKGAQYGIDPQAATALQGIGQDLQRASVSNSVRAPGSDTAYNLAANGWLARNLYGPSFGGASGLGKAVGAVGAAAAGHPMIGLGILGGGNQVGKMVGSRLNAKLVDMLMNPQAALPYLAARSAATQPALAASLVGRIPLSLANTVPNALASNIYGARQ